MDSRSRDGRSLLFADLYDHTLAWVVFGLTQLGIAAITVGLLADLSAAVAVGGAALSAGGLITGVNLVARPLRLRPATLRVATESA